MNRYIVAKRRPDGRLVFHSYTDSRPVVRELADAIWDIKTPDEMWESSMLGLKVRKMKEVEPKQ